MPKEEKNRRAFDAPEDLDRWIEREVKESHVKFSPWIVQLLFKIKKLKEEGVRGL